MRLKTHGHSPSCVALHYGTGDTYLRDTTLTQKVPTWDGIVVVHGLGHPILGIMVYRAIARRTILLSRSKADNRVRVAVLEVGGTVSRSKPAYRQRNPLLNGPPDLPTTSPRRTKPDKRRALPSRGYVVKKKPGKSLIVLEKREAGRIKSTHEIRTSELAIERALAYCFGATVVHRNRRRKGWRNGGFGTVSPPRQAAALIGPCPRHRAEIERCRT